MTRKSINSTISERDADPGLADRVQNHIRTALVGQEGEALTYAAAIQQCQELLDCGELRPPVEELFRSVQSSLQFKVNKGTAASEIASLQGVRYRVLNSTKANKVLTLETMVGKVYISCTDKWSNVYAKNVDQVKISPIPGSNRMRVTVRYEPNERGATKSPSYSANHQALREKMESLEVKMDKIMANQGEILAHLVADELEDGPLAEVLEFVKPETRDGV